MKVITLKKFKKVSYIIFGIMLTLVIVGNLFPVKISINQDTINQKVREKLPLSIKKDIKIPLTNHYETIKVDIETNHVSLVDDLMNVSTSGTAFHKDKSVRFSVTTFGKELYYNPETFSFYFKPKDIKVTLNQEDVDKLTPIKKIETIPVEQEETETPSKTSMFSKIKNRFSKKDEDTELKVNSEGLSLKIGNNTINKLKNKALTKYNGAIDNGLKESIQGYLTKGVEYAVIKGLNEIPVYKLRDKDIDNKAKLFLTGLNIKNNKLSISFSMANILKGSIMFIFAIALFFLVLEMLSRKVEKQEKVSFFNLFDVVLSIAEVGLTVVCEVGGGLLDV